MLTDPKLPGHVKNIPRLGQEATSLIAGGTDTSAMTLRCILFHLLDNPNKLELVKQEIWSVWPDVSTAPPRLSQLEALPYLVSHQEYLNPISIVPDPR